MKQWAPAVVGKDSRGLMSQIFSYAVTTALQRHSVWKLFIDIRTWPSFGGVYSELKWDGDAWVQGSAIIGELLYPMAMPLRHVIKRCQPPELISYLAYGSSGFAMERTICFKSIPSGTRIEVESFAAGTPAKFPGGMAGFLEMLTLQYFDNFARLCDETHRATVTPPQCDISIRDSWE
jgi:hypothetical protein